ncbi:growth/differentiation factor 9 isoform X2 [Tachyglossus aculeatus]|uniref:growth/differentiation factor 9 isoform X2 n=1 Tax=Tachyglossus aculeatus TaxID=9261 RepID=UPI0018F75E1D|nr:growth/differentiation factor 9 isoform X2 [Tachyglossus aculeatus]
MVVPCVCLLGCYYFWFLPPVLSDRHHQNRQRGMRSLQPDSTALGFMKRLYRMYASKEGIPKSNRSHLYNTVRLFTPDAEPKWDTEDQRMGLPGSADLTFNLDRVTVEEHLLKSVLLYSFNNSIPFSSAIVCPCQLVVKELESSSPECSRAPCSLNFNLDLKLRKKRRWVEIDVTALLGPLIATNKRSVKMAVNFTCLQDRDRHSSVPNEPLNKALLRSPSLLLYLNDTSNQAYHNWYSLRSGEEPPIPWSGQRRGFSTFPGERVAPRRGREAQRPKNPASYNLSEYLKQFLFPENECELHDFRLSFSQLHWDNWIIAPQRYNPRYCQGDCPRAVGHRYGSPVHAMVQNIIYEKLDSSIPRPSCVPAQYSPLSVLTIEPDDSIAYKEYEDMIATKCTCR